MDSINKVVDWDEIRKLFPVTQKYTYTNAAEGSPVSELAAAEGKRFYDEILHDGDLHWEDWLKRTEETRQKLAEFINADRSEVAFTINTSHGMNLIADMLRGKGDVVTMQDEFPSSTYPWLHRNYGVKFIEPENHKYSIENIAKSIDEKTKILVTSYVQYCTGFRQDLVELGKFCKSKGLIFVVNATQGIGAMPIDVKEANIDFLVFTCFKWTLSGYGIGGLYISKEWLGKIDFPVAGWRSVEDPYKMDNKNMKLKMEASEIEIGDPHFPNIFALGGALDLLNRIGQENIQERIFSLNDYLVKKLEELGLEIISPLERKYRSGITVVKLDNAEEVVEKLRKENIIISQRKEGVRISMHIYNNEEDIDKLIMVLRKVIGLNP